MEASSDTLDPDINPQSSPRADPYVLPPPIISLWLVSGVCFGLWPYFISCLPIIALGRKTWDLHKLQIRLNEEKRRLEKELNFLRDEAKRRDAKLSHLQARSKRMEKERDMALGGGK